MASGSAPCSTDREAIRQICVRYPDVGNRRLPCDPVAADTVAEMTSKQYSLYRHYLVELLRVQAAATAQAPSRGPSQPLRQAYAAKRLREEELLRAPEAAQQRARARVTLAPTGATKNLRFGPAQEPPAPFAGSQALTLRQVVGSAQKRLRGYTVRALTTAPFPVGPTPSPFPASSVSRAGRAPRPSTCPPRPRGP